MNGLLLRVEGAISVRVSVVRRKKEYWRYGEEGGGGGGKKKLEEGLGGRGVRNHMALSWDLKALT